MSGAREIYREIKKATKYREKVEDIQKIENIQERAKALKEIDKEISTNDTNDNEYRKIDEWLKFLKWRKRICVNILNMKR